MLVLKGALKAKFTCKPGGVDIVSSIVIRGGAEEDSVAVSRQQVWAPVLALVTDLQCCAVLSLAGVVRTNQLKQTRFSTFGVCEPSIYLVFTIQ